MEEKTILVKTAKELERAKHNVEFCLNNMDGLVDMKGLVYWANRVEILRKKIKELL